ncbi:MAG: cytochrome c3 family protein, partial [Holophagae bacterium]
MSSAHEGLDDPDSCDSCHNDDLEVEGDRCLVCHDRIADRMAAGKGLHREVTVDDCAMCHAEHGGRNSEMLPLDRDDFDHAAETGFALEGFHGEFAGDCSRCHTTRSFLELEPGCASCHGDAHKGTLGTDCRKCHQVDRHFKNASRAFHKSALLPLEGRHLEVPCADCHLDPVIEGTPTRCYDCHWIRRQDSPHGTRLGNECEDCHRPISWLAVNWEHGAATGFPLNGAHHTVDCTGCHPDHRYDLPADPDCYSCHIEDYNEAREPNHAAAGFPTDCQQCHSPADPSWGGATFDHMLYPLVGRHATLDCDACHSSGVYQGLPSDCVDCHMSDYEGADNPDHIAAG